jgi:hypothetical protein
VVVEAAEDAQGVEKNKVVQVKPRRKGKVADVGSADDSEAPEKGFRMVSS